MLPSCNRSPMTNLRSNAVVGNCNFDEWRNQQADKTAVHSHKSIIESRCLFSLHNVGKSPQNVSFRLLCSTYSLFKFDTFSKLIVGVMDVILQSLQYAVANDSSGSISHHGHYVDNDRAPLRPPNHRSRVYRMKKRKSRADDKIETFLYSQAIAASYNTRKHHPNVSSKKVHSDTVAVSVYPLRKPPPQYRLDQYSSRPLVLFSDNLFCQLCHVIHTLF